MSITIREMTNDELDTIIQKENIDRTMHVLSKYDLEPLLNYTNDRIETGGFLRAVLENDLKEAMGRADIYNRRKIFEYVQWLYNKAPATCWGSPEKVRAWLAGCPERNEEI